MKMSGPKGARSATKHFAALVGVNLEVKESIIALAAGKVVVISIIGAMAAERIDFFEKVAAMKNAAATMLHLPSKNDS